jgi:hypothetical protein
MELGYAHGLNNNSSMENGKLDHGKWVAQR